jgi:hypothetical protein
MNLPISAQSLGAPLANYPYDPEQRKVSLFVGLGFLGLAVAFPVLYWLDPVAVGQTVFLSPVVAVGGILTLAHWAYTAGISLSVHQGGFVHGAHVVPWGRVRGIRYKLVHVIGGSATYNRGFFEVRLDDGSKVKTNMQLENMEKVIGHVVAQTMPILCEGMAQAIRAGQVVRCGPFELQSQGIVCKGKSIPWARAALSTGGDATLQLLDVAPDGSGHTKVHEAKIADVENSDALEALAEQLRVQALRAR